MQKLICDYCGRGILYSGFGMGSGLKPFRDHQRRCKNASPKEREHYARLGYWPKKGGRRV